MHARFLRQHLCTALNGLMNWPYYSVESWPLVLPLYPQPENAVSSPVYQFEQASMLHSHSHLLHSPSLIHGAHAFQSPSWSNDFSAIAASLILPPPHVVDTTDEAGGGALTTCGMHMGTGQLDVHHVQGQQQQPLPGWQPLGALYDIEAHVTFPTTQPCGGGSGGASATTR